MKHTEIDTVEDIPQESKDEFVDGVCRGLETVLGTAEAAEYIHQIRTDPLLVTPEAAVNFAYGAVLENHEDLGHFIDATKLLEPKAEKE